MRFLKIVIALSKDALEVNKTDFQKIGRNCSEKVWENSSETRIQESGDVKS